MVWANKKEVKVHFIMKKQTPRVLAMCNKDSKMHKKDEDEKERNSD